MALPTPGVTPANWGAQLNQEVVDNRLARAPIPGSGEYLTSVYGTGNTTGPVLSLGDMIACPIYVAGDITVTGIAVTIDSATASAVHRLGIYSPASDGRPGALLIDGGTVSSATTGVKTVTISQALDSGLYWGVAVPQTAVARYRSFTNIPGYPIVGASNLIIQTPNQNYWRATGATGALPSNPSWAFVGGGNASDPPIVGLIV